MIKALLVLIGLEIFVEFKSVELLKLDPVELLKAGDNVLLLSPEGFKGEIEEALLPIIESSISDLNKGSYFSFLTRFFMVSSCS